MLFWAGVLVVLAVVATALSWGMRGYEEREHVPGTQRLRPPSGPASPEASPPVWDDAARTIRRPSRDDA